MSEKEGKRNLEEPLLETSLSPDGKKGSRHGLFSAPQPGSRTMTTLLFVSILINAVTIFILMTGRAASSENKYHQTPETEAAFGESQSRIMPVWP